MKRARRLQLLAALAVVLAFVACTLNPQPLPPLDPENAATSEDAGSFGPRRDAGALPDDDDDPPSSDASTSPPDGGAGGDGGDASDAGDAGDDAGDGGDVSDPD